MKKLLSFLAIGVFAILPMSASALEFKWECENPCRNESTEKCEETCEVYLLGNTDLKDLSVTDVTLTLTGDADKVTLKSLTPANDNMEVESSRDGDVISMKFTNLTEIKTSKVELGTLVLELEDSAVDCSGYFTFKGVEYEKTTEEPDEPSTGAALPVAILTCGVGAAAVIYFVSKKNKKMYKI